MAAETLAAYARQTVLSPDGMFFLCVCFPGIPGLAGDPSIYPYSIL
jgi:hypothetical protein